MRADAEQPATWVRENLGGGAGGQGGMPVVRCGLAAGTIRFQQEFGP